MSLAEVRGNIDRIDHAIVALMAERAKYVAEAGRFKPDPAECGRTLGAMASTRRSRKRPIGR
jgi:isochorismate pyruvate lyase